MIVPVLRTTGVNTKILVALELGVPLVITPVAASPFDIPDNETVVAFANQAADFTQQVRSACAGRRVQPHSAYAPPLTAAERGAWSKRCAHGSEWLNSGQVGPHAPQPWRSRHVGLPKGKSKKGCQLQH
eukprot:scaffold22404_cov112-Isochrysis_galbana.AAC.7